MRTLASAAAPPDFPAAVMSRVPHQQPDVPAATGRCALAQSSPEELSWESTLHHRLSSSADREELDGESNSCQQLRKGRHRRCHPPALSLSTSNITHIEDIVSPGAAAASPLSFPANDEEQGHHSGDHTEDNNSEHHQEDGSQKYWGKQFESDDDGGSSNAGSSHGSSHSSRLVGPRCQTGNGIATKRHRGSKTRYHSDAPQPNSLEQRLRGKCGRRDTAAYTSAAGDYSYQQRCMAAAIRRRRIRQQFLQSDSRRSGGGGKKGDHRLYSGPSAAPPLPVPQYSSVNHLLSQVSADQGPTTNNTPPERPVQLDLVPRTCAAGLECSRCARLLEADFQDRFNISLPGSRRIPPPLDNILLNFRDNHDRAVPFCIPQAWLHQLLDSSRQPPDPPIQMRNDAWYFNVILDFRRSKCWLTSRADLRSGTCVRDRAQVMLVLAPFRLPLEVLRQAQEQQQLCRLTARQMLNESAAAAPATSMTTIQRSREPRRCTLPRDHDDDIDDHGDKAESFSPLAVAAPSAGADEGVVLCRHRGGGCRRRHDHVCSSSLAQHSSDSGLKEADSSCCWSGSDHSNCGCDSTTSDHAASGVLYNLLFVAFRIVNLFLLVPFRLSVGAMLNWPLVQLIRYWFVWSQQLLTLVIVASEIAACSPTPLLGISLLLHHIFVEPVEALGRWCLNVDQDELLQVIDATRQLHVQRKDEHCSFAFHRWRLAIAASSTTHSRRSTPTAHEATPYTKPSTAGSTAVPAIGLSKPLYG